MHVVVIHDPRRVDRMAILRQELDRQGIRLYTIIPAVTGGKPVSNISRAHKNCISYAMENKFPSVVIMEDDVMFTFPGAYNHFINSAGDLPPGWNMLLSGVYDGRINSFTDTVATVSNFSGLHCYMVNSSFYKTILSADERINLDKWISSPDWGNNTCFMTYPMTALQHDGYSDNVRRKTQYNKDIKGRFKLWTPPQET